MKKNFWNLMASICHFIVALVLIFGIFKVDSTVSKLAFILAAVFLIFSGTTFFKIYKANKKK